MDELTNLVNAAVVSVAVSIPIVYSGLNMHTYYLEKGRLEMKKILDPTFDAKSEPILKPIKNTIERALGYIGAYLAHRSFIKEN